MDVLLETALVSSPPSSIHLLQGCDLTDLDYADDIALVSEDPVSLQTFLSNLDECSRLFGMRFAPSKCKLMLQDWVSTTHSLTISGETLEVVDKFVYLGSCLTNDGRISEEVSKRIQKARLAFSKLRHLWCRKDISLSVKGRVYAAAVRPVLLYGSETWPRRAEDIRRLSVFDNHCLRCIAGVWWEHRISNEEVRRRLFGSEGTVKSLEVQLNLHRLRWLGHVLRMSENRLRWQAMFSEVGKG